LEFDSYNFSKGQLKQWLKLKLNFIFVLSFSLFRFVAQMKLNPLEGCVVWMCDEEEEHTSKFD
jgi:hypothetical protein